jgi:hypothetical protein
VQHILSKAKPPALFKISDRCHSTKSLTQLSLQQIPNSCLFFLILTLLDLDPDSPALIKADPDPQQNKANPELECIV